MPELLPAPWLNAHLLFISEGTTIVECIDKWWLNWGTLYIAVGILYLPLIFTLQYFWRNKEPVNIKYWRIIHNLAFCVFSAIGAIELTPTMINTWISSDYNFHRTVCDGYFIHQAEAFWVFAFVLSKLFELFESLYYIVEKKPLPFLHWYHHFATYTFSTQALFLKNHGAIYYSWMNLVVHAIMYLYYTIASTGKRPSWGIVVTVGQILQMFIGVAVCWEIFSCDNPVYNKYSAWFGFLMYCSYVFLFIKFFVYRYVFPQKKSNKKPTKKE